MLSYFRYISVISFVLVLVAAFFAGSYFRSFAVERLIEQPLINNSKHVANYYSERIWCAYRPAMHKLNGNTLFQSTILARLKKASLLLLNTVPADKIDMHYQVRGADAVEIFSTHDRDIVFFEQARSAQESFKQAQRDGTASQMVYSSGKYDEQNSLTKGAVFEVAVEMSGRECHNNAEEASQAVLFFYYDQQGAVNQLRVFQFAVTGGIIVTFLLLYLALFLSSRRAEKIINKQHDENLVLTEAKTRAEIQNKEKSMFLANISHELRTPLNAIIGFSEIIRDEVMGPLNNQQYKEYISDINISGVHLLSLINDILDYSKAEAQKLEVDLTDVDLTKTVHSCMRLMEPRANEAKVRLVEEMPEKSVVIVADPKRMKQVILNLLSNAVKFTPEKGQVTVEISQDIAEQKILISVYDTGIGIAPKDISKALAPFGQVDSALSRRYEGTGLGLPLTKKLTEIMHGTFELRSEEGLGTTVTLTFPMNGSRVNTYPQQDDKEF